MSGLDDGERRARVLLSFLAQPAGPVLGAALRSSTAAPTQLDDLGDARPLLLWARGTADLRLTCVNSVSMAGSRAATGYGNHVRSRWQRP
jgi:hypothetical protein